jgi:hypothetical protein
LYTPGTTVTLRAIPEIDSDFSGWSGCDKSYGRRCVVKMDADKTVTATFVGPSVTLTSPHGGENWKAGLHKRIEWNFTGNPGPHVRIELLKGEALYATLVKRTWIGIKGRGSFPWHVPRRLPHGSDYKIRITSTKNRVYTDTSDASFTILSHDGSTR